MFHFSITDLGEFLGKSPVTLRAWERKGLVTLPRVGNNRQLTIDELHAVATIARKHERITDERFLLIADALQGLRFIEMENE